MKTLFFSALTFGVWVVASSGFAATPPYLEDFESYAVGDTAVTNFTEVNTPVWTIVSPSISGKGYQDAISVSLGGSGVNGQNSSSGISKWVEFEYFTSKSLIFSSNSKKFSSSFFLVSKSLKATA